MHNRLAVFDSIFLPDHVCVVGEEAKKWIFARNWKKHIISQAKSYRRESWYLDEREGSDDNDMEHGYMRRGYEWEPKAIYTSSRSSSEIECSMFTQNTFSFLFTLSARRWFAVFHFSQLHHRSLDIVGRQRHRSLHRFMKSQQRRTTRRCHCAVVAQLSMENDYDVIRVNAHVWSDDYATFSSFTDSQLETAVRRRQRSFVVEKEIFCTFFTR